MVTMRLKYDVSILVCLVRCSSLPSSSVVNNSLGQILKKNNNSAGTRIVTILHIVLKCQFDYVCFYGEEAGSKSGGLGDW